MSSRLVPKLVTLNEPERRNGPYFALFHRIFVYDVVVKQLLGLPRFQNLALVQVYHSLVKIQSACDMTLCRHRTLSSVQFLDTMPYSQM